MGAIGARDHAGIHRVLFLEIGVQRRFPEIFFAKTDKLIILQPPASIDHPAEGLPFVGAPPSASV